MNNNIGNMGGANPAGFNPQNPKQAPAQECQGPQCPQVEASSADPLKFVPGDQYGRAMVNQNPGALPPAINPQNIHDDVFTFQLMQEFGQELIQGFIARGVDPANAQNMAALAMDVLMNPNLPPQAPQIRQ